MPWTEYLRLFSAKLHTISHTNATNSNIDIIKTSGGAVKTCRLDDIERGALAKVTCQETSLAIRKQNFQF